MTGFTAVIQTSRYKFTKNLISEQNHVVGIMKTQLSMRLLFGTPKTHLNKWIRKQLGFYAREACLFGPMVTHRLSNQECCNVRIRTKPRNTGLQDH